MREKRRNGAADIVGYPKPDSLISAEGSSCGSRSRRDEAVTPGGTVDQSRPKKGWVEDGREADR
jgi:hypothetical protein